MIKCNSCGSPLEIEQAYCPYCGTPNAYFKKHREDMQAYDEEFKETRQEVYTHTTRFTGNAVSVAIISVLVVLNILVFVLTSQAWRIVQLTQEASVNANYSQHKAVLDEFEAEGDLLGFVGYYEENSIYYSEKLEEFDRYYWVASNYKYVHQYMVELKFDELTRDRYDQKIEAIADATKFFFDRMEYSEYYEEQFTEVHVAAMNVAKERLLALYEGYAGATPEELEALPEMGKSGIMQLLEKGVEYREIEDE